MDSEHEGVESQSCGSQAFGAAAALYDRARPGYPTEAVSWALEPAGTGRLRVVDLGSGTGILTRALLRLGHEVLPVEPDGRMRAQMAAVTPGADPLCGRAEAMPLLDGSVDAVVAGQAYHWFDPARAHSEIARVLRPGGVFSVIWNDRDESVSWLAELSVLMNGLAGPHATTQSAYASPVLTGVSFAPVTHETFRHETTHTVDSLVDLIRSRSYFLTATPQRQERIVSAVRTLASEHPDLDTGSTFQLPYLTRVYRAVRAVQG